MEAFLGAQLEITVGKEFEKNFRYLMSMIDHVEWGGLVLFDINGTFADKVIKIKLIDFALLDIGTVATTINDYDENPEFVKRLMEYPNKPYGLIHSHTHDVYYSKTDLEEIEANERFYPDGYLSVVVNARGHILVRLNKEYSAEVTKHIKFGTKKRTITRTYTDIFYVEKKININKSTSYITERLHIIGKEKKAAQKALDAHKGKTYSNTSMHMRYKNNKELKKMHKAIEQSGEYNYEDDEADRAYEEYNARHEHY